MEVSDHDSDEEPCYDGYEVEDVMENSNYSTESESHVHEFIPDVSEWCLCDNCSQMPTLEDSYCCTQSEMISEFMIRDDLDCIIQSQQLRSLVESEDNLRYSRYLMSFQIEDKRERSQYLKAEMDNRLLRHLAYKSFVFMIHAANYVGRHNRVRLPSCVIMRIRELYPDPENNYAGFSSNEDTNVMSYKDM